MSPTFIDESSSEPTLGFQYLNISLKSSPLSALKAILPAPSAFELSSTNFHNEPSPNDASNVVLDNVHPSVI